MIPSVTLLRHGPGCARGTKTWLHERDTNSALIEEHCRCFHHIVNSLGIELAAFGAFDSTSKAAYILEHLLEQPQSVQRLH